LKFYLFCKKPTKRLAYETQIPYYPEADWCINTNVYLRIPFLWLNIPSRT